MSLVSIKWDMVSSLLESINPHTSSFKKISGVYNEYEAFAQVYQNSDTR